MPTRANVQEIDTGAVKASSLTLADYTPSAGSNRVLEVCVAYGDTTLPTCAVAFGAVAMTSRGQAIDPNANSYAVEVFTLNEADWPSTPADIVASLNRVSGVRIVASTITDVDQTTPMDVAVVTTVPGLNVNPWSSAITTATDGAMVSSFGWGSDARTLSSVGSGQANVRLDTDSVEVSGVDINRTLLWEDAEVPTAGAVTMQATWNSGHARSSIVTLAYRPAVTLETLTIDSQPTTATSGVAMGNVVVSSSDSASTATVTATIETGAGALSGTTSGAMVAGEITFSNLIITGAGAHTLAFNATGHDEVVSATITVSASGPIAAAVRAYRRNQLLIPE